MSYQRSPLLSDPVPTFGTPQGTLTAALARGDPVVDGHPTRRSKLLKEFVASTAAALKLFVLPANSPQLNPDEWVWKNVKHDRVERTSVTGLDDFKAKTIGALGSLQKLPRIVRAFFADPDQRYITV